MKPMHDSVVTSKRTSKLIWLAAAMSLGLFACQVEDSIERDNPGDAAGANYHLPTVSVTTPADTVFRDSSSLRILVRDSSANSRVVRLRWSLDGSLSDSTTDASWHPTSGLSEGAHVIVVRAVDSTGLVSLPDTVRVKVYNKPPVLTHVRDTTQSANKSLTIKLLATDSDGTVSKLLWGTTKGVWTDSTGTVSLSPMAEGAKKIYWAARDDLGKVSVDSFTATFTNLAPTLTHVRDTTLLTSQAFTVTLSATDSDGAVKEYLFDTTENGWDSSVTAPTLHIASASEGARKVRWAARDDLGKATADSFMVTFVMDRPVLAAASDTTISASKALVVSLNAHPLNGSSSVIAEYLWSTNGSTWDSSSTASASFSDTAGGVLTVQWKARNSLGNYSKLDTFVATFLHVPTITSLSVDSNLFSWTSGTGSLIFTWAGSIASASGEAITWALSGGTNGLSQLYSGAATTYTQAGIDSGVNYSYRLVGKNRFGDSAVLTGIIKTQGPSGTFTDARDGQTYRYVTIGTQKWMAQNLNYRNATGSSDTVGVCYSNLRSNCAMYGRLYTWSEVMNGSSSSSTTPSGIQGICPSGWHVPSDPEWSVLTTFAGGEATAGTTLKANSSLWSMNTGTDVYGFSVLPTGIRYADGTFDDLSQNAYFWSSSEYDVHYAWYRCFLYNYTYVYHYNYGLESLGFSLRCVK